MKYSKAAKIAIESMKKEAQKYAIDANLLEYGIDNPTNISAAQKRKDIFEAIEVLKRLPDNVRKLSTSETDSTDDLIEILEMLK